MSSTDNLPRPADSPCLKCASAGCTSITVGKGGDRKTFPGCAIWQQWFSDRWQGYQATAYKMKCLREGTGGTKMSENVFVGADSFRRLLLGAAGGYELQGRHEAAETVLRVIDALDELTTGGKGGDRADEDQEPWRLRKPFGSTVKSAGKQDAAARTASSTKATKARFARFMAARWAGIDSEEKKMAEKRIVDIGPLLEDLKNELEDLKGATEVLTVEEAAEDEIEELKNCW